MTVGDSGTLQARLAEGRRVAAAVLAEAIGSSPLDPGAVVLVDAGGFAEQGVSGVRRYGGDDELRVCIQSFAPPPEMVILGAVVCSAALAGHVSALGHHETICDARAAFVRSPRFAACGLDVGARTPEETAISVLAEIVARRTGRAGAALVGTSGSIRGGERAAAA